MFATTVCIDATPRKAALHDDRQPCHPPGPARGLVADEAALDQGQDAALQARDDLDVVGGDQHRGAEGGDVLEQVHDLPGRFHVEVAGRLVGDQDRRLG